MNDLDLERALATNVEPSAFFVSRVMTAVRSEAAVPPLAFPLWRFAAAVVVFAITVILGATA